MIWMLKCISIAPSIKNHSLRRPLKNKLTTRSILTLHEQKIYAFRKWFSKTIRVNSPNFESKVLKKRSHNSNELTNWAITRGTSILLTEKYEPLTWTIFGYGQIETRLKSLLELFIVPLDIFLSTKSRQEARNCLRLQSTLFKLPTELILKPRSSTRYANHSQAILLTNILKVTHAYWRVHVPLVNSTVLRPVVTKTMETRFLVFRHIWYI